MRILVIGGTGITGPYVVKSLNEMGHEVTIFHSGEHEADLPSEVNHIHHPPRRSEGDRRHLADFIDEFKKLAPQVVLDMAPFYQEDAQFLMKTFRGIASRVVALSSIDVYLAYGRLHHTEPGPVQPMPLTEDAALRKTKPPSRDENDKIGVEQEVMSDPDLPGTILRLPAIYQSRADGRLFFYLKHMDDKRPAILLSGEYAQWRWSRGFAENVAAAIVLAATDERAAGRIYNVAEPEAFTEAEWVRAIGQAAGWDGEVVAMPKEFIPDHLVWMTEPNWSQHYVVDTIRIRQELGYHEVVSRDEWLGKAIEGTRANPPDMDSKHFDYAAEDAALEKMKKHSD